MGRLEKLQQQDAGRPFTGIEFGTYVGYSAVRIARLLPAGSKLITVDPGGMQDVAHEVVSLAGLTDKVEFMQGTALESTQQLAKSGVKLDFVFIDHDKSDYLASLRRLEASGLLREGAVVVADNVDVFQINRYLQHVRSSGLYESYHVSASLEYTSVDDNGMPQIRD